MELRDTDLVILGGGPGGYAAACDAADRGRRVILVEQDERLGGTCLHRGCIPSKALLHATGLIREAAASARRGIEFPQPAVHLERLRAWTDSLLTQLAQGLSHLSRARAIQVVQGRGRFEDSQTLCVETPAGRVAIRCERAIIAVGSTPALPPAFDLGDHRVMTSTEALQLRDIPRDLLVIGGGYIGLELGTLYATLGSRVTLVEAMETILPGVDADLVRPVLQSAQQRFADVFLGTTVRRLIPQADHIVAVCEAGGVQREARFDKVLVAVGRVPNHGDLGLERTRVRLDARGFIQVDAAQQTADPAISAVGDVVGGPMLAHKATLEARVAVGAMAGERRTAEDALIPAVVFTDPEVAWCGLTETEAKARGIPAQVARVPWSASGRALTLDRSDGLTKLLVDPKTERLLGVGIVGTGAGELISEGALALTTGATAKDLADTVHPHPTLSETLKECAEVFYGTAAHVLGRRRPSTPC